MCVNVWMCSNLLINLVYYRGRIQIRFPTIFFLESFNLFFHSAPLIELCRILTLKRKVNWGMSKLFPKSWIDKLRCSPSNATLRSRGGSGTILTPEFFWRILASLFHVVQNRRVINV